jgi:hypothetical protein
MHLGDYSLLDVTPFRRIPVFGHEELNLVCRKMHQKS